MNTSHSDAGAAMSTNTYTESAPCLWLDKEDEPKKRRKQKDTSMSQVENAKLRGGIVKKLIRNPKWPTSLKPLKRKKNNENRWYAWEDQE